jgi:hypothetical protein
MSDVGERNLTDDPSATLRGFRHQALYILMRILTADEDQVFLPERIEDLAVYGSSGELEEIVQVKSYTSPLVRSSFGTPFFLRAATHVRNHLSTPIVIASYGPVGPSLDTAVRESDSSERRALVRDVTNIIGDEEVAIEIADHLRIEQVTEEEVVKQIIQKISSLCTGIEPQRALDILWWWVYSACEKQEQIDRKRIILTITQTGQFLADRAAWHREWFTTIVPFENIEISAEHKESLAEEFATGVAARLEHIIAGVDVRRDGLIGRVLDSFRRSNLTVIHGASGQGKTALAYRCCREFFPLEWCYRLSHVENASHAHSVALALVGHAKASPFDTVVFLDVAPGNVAWVDLVKRLAGHQAIKIFVAVREEDWRRSFAQLAELNYGDVELMLDKKEAEAIYNSIRDSHDIAHVLNFPDAWQSFGGNGPLLEFVYFLRHNDTLEGRLKCQVTQIQDAVRCGKLSRQELDFLRLAAVATAHEAWVDLRKLTETARVPEPQRTVEIFEREYFIRLSEDRRHLVALHPIRSSILSRLLTDASLSPWVEVAQRVLGIIRESDLERFLLFAFAHEPANRAAVVESVKSLQTETWAGLCGCMRALLWLGVRQYADENGTLIQEAFSKYNEGWQVMLNCDIAGIADSAPWEALASLGEIGQRASDAARDFVSRQTDPRRVFSHCTSFMGTRSHPPSHPVTDMDRSALGEVCFWISHLKVECRVRDWVTEDLLTDALLQAGIGAMSDACIGVFTMWGRRYQEWYQTHRKEIHRRVRTALQAISLTEEGERVSAVFLICQEEVDPAGTYNPSAPLVRSLNDLVVAKLNVIRNVMPFFETYGCRGVGHLNGSIDPPYDESIKSGVLKKYLPPRWAPSLNNQFLQLGTFTFRPRTWTDFADSVLRVRKETLDLFAQIREGILAHFTRKEVIKIVGDYVRPGKWLSLQAACPRVELLPQCAVDEFGLDASPERRTRSTQTGQEMQDAQRPVDSYLHAAREYARTLRNFLLQAPPVLARNTAVNKVRRRQYPRRMKSLRQEAGADAQRARLTTLNLKDFCRSLAPLQQQTDRMFAERVGFDQHKKLSEQENDEAPHFCLFWQKFVNHPSFPADALARTANRKRLMALNARDLLAQLRDGLAAALTQAGGDAVHFRILDVAACWDGEPTLWIVCDASDLCRLVDASCVVEESLRRSLGAWRGDEAIASMVDLYWRHIVALPLAGGKSLRRLAYPHLGGALRLASGSKSSRWRHIPLPVAEEVWRDLGLDVWRLPRLLEFQDFADAVSELWKTASHYSDLARVEGDFDELGAEIAQAHIQAGEKAFSATLQDVLDQHVRLWEYFGAIPEVQRGQRPMLVKCFSILSELEERLLPREDLGRAEKVSLTDLKKWHSRLSEAIGLVGMAEIFWSADVLKLECDSGRLIEMLNSYDQLQT